MSAYGGNCSPLTFRTWRLERARFGQRPHFGGSGSRLSSGSYGSPQRSDRRHVQRRALKRA